MCKMPEPESEAETALSLCIVLATRASGRPNFHSVAKIGRVSVLAEASLHPQNPTDLVRHVHGLCLAWVHSSRKFVLVSQAHHDHCPHQVCVLVKDSLAISGDSSISSSDIPFYH